MKLTRIFETCLYATDLSAAERFYTTVLGLEIVAVSDLDRGIAFHCGNGVLLIFDPQKTRSVDASVPKHGAIGPGHIAFAVEPSRLNAWREHLQRCGVSIEKEIEWPEGGRSIYFRDPAGNILELAPPTLWGFPG